jgi:hypothetical protein
MLSITYKLIMLSVIKADFLHTLSKTVWGGGGLGGIMQLIELLKSQTDFEPLKI